MKLPVDGLTNTAIEEQSEIEGCLLCYHSMAGYSSEKIVGNVVLNPEVSKNIKLKYLYSRNESHHVAGGSHSRVTPKAKNFFGVWY